MNARERLFAALEGRETDRTPVWLLFPYHKTGYYTDVRNNPHYKDIVAMAEKYAITLDRRGIWPRLFAPEVRIESKAFTEDCTKISKTVIEYKGRQLVSETKYGKDKTTVSKLIKNEDELAFYCSLPMNVNRRRIEEELKDQVEKYLLERAGFPEELGSMMLDLGEPVSRLYHSSELEEYAIWSLTCPDLVKDFLDRAMEHYRIVYSICLEKKLAETYFLVGSELASPPLLSRSTFQSWIVPYGKELISMIRNSGAKSIQHYHGQIKEILPDFLEMGADGLHTIEAPPIGNCTFAEAFAATKNKITLIGNIQYDCFRSFTGKEMEQAVLDVLAECRGKRLIISPSAGPYEDVISPQMRKNYEVFIKTAWGNC
ncbi:MAG: uroporphyrinogen decarboxylase family protein [Victivallales bacterium]